MKRLLSIALVLALTVATISTLTASASSTEITGNFSYYSNALEADTTYTFTYDDAWFRYGTYYRHNLAQMSLRLAMAAGKQTPEHIEELFDTLGFSYTDESVSYPTPAFDYDAGTTIGYAIGSKTISGESGDCTLIAIVPRGSGYGEEWGSNFEMGPGARHAGFEKSAKQVTDALEAYIAANIKDNTKLKFWVTGFSRGAAVANVIAHNINAKIDADTWNASKDDVFAYTFESPLTVTTDAPDYDIDINIFNIINPADLVAHIPPESWGYVRYGIDCPLPVKSDSEDYADQYARELAQFEALFTAALPDSTPESIAKQAANRSKCVDGQPELCVNFIDELAAIFKSHDNYAQNCERDMCNLLKEALGENGDLLSIILNNPFPEALSVILKYGGNIETVLNAHYPELEIAWMDALTEDEISPTITIWDPPMTTNTSKTTPSEQSGSVTVPSLTATVAEPTETAAEPTSTNTETAATAAKPTETNTAAPKTETVPATTETNASSTTTAKKTKPATTNTFAEPVTTATEVTPFVLVGDANSDGVINMKDVLTVRKYLADIPVKIDLVGADMTRDDAVNMKDVLALRLRIAYNKDAGQDEVPFTALDSLDLGGDESVWNLPRISVIRTRAELETLMNYANPDPSVASKTDISAFTDDYFKEHALVLIHHVTGVDIDEIAAFERLSDTSIYLRYNTPEWTQPWMVFSVKLIEFSAADAENLSTIVTPDLTSGAAQSVNFPAVAPVAP